MFYSLKRELRLVIGLATVLSASQPASAYQVLPGQQAKPGNGSASIETQAAN